MIDRLMFTSQGLNCQHHQEVTEDIRTPVSMCNYTHLFCTHNLQFIICVSPIWVTPLPLARILSFVFVIADFTLDAFNLSGRAILQRSV